MENLSFVIVGHVDHGKSTLIGRLLYDTNSLTEGKVEEIKKVCDMLGKPFEFGFILDNLDEERSQGVTIDTTQIWFRTKEREYRIIDAPGHVEFVKNMITGASQAEAAILIVDAKEGVKEQTKRHSYILSMLGITQVIVVINKMDIVDFSETRFNEVLNELRAHLSNVGVSPAFTIPISANEGDNVVKKSDRIPWYNGPTVLEGLNGFKIREPGVDKPLRFAVQDVYKWDERIIAGIVESGTLKLGEEIVILPSGERTVVEGIREYGKEHPASAEPGKAIGIVTRDKVFIDRGDIICSQNNPPPPVNSFEGTVFWMSKDPLDEGDRIVVKLSTQKAVAIVEIQKLLDSSTMEEIPGRKQLRNREVGDVIFRLDKEIVVENFNVVPELGRFVLERVNVCGGGIVK